MLYLYIQQLTMADFTSLGRTVAPSLFTTRRYHCLSACSRGSLTHDQTEPCACHHSRGGLGEKSGPGVTVRPAHLIHGALPTQYTTRCPLKALHVSTSQWPTWKNTHTLTLDDYKEITSYIYIFYNIWIHQFGHTGWTHGIK